MILNFLIFRSIMIDKKYSYLIHKIMLLQILIINQDKIFTRIKNLIKKVQKKFKMFHFINNKIYKDTVKIIWITFKVLIKISKIIILYQIIKNISKAIHLSGIKTNKTDYPSILMNNFLKVNKNISIRHMVLQRMLKMPIKTHLIMVMTKSRDRIN